MAPTTQKEPDAGSVTTASAETTSPTSTASRQLPAESARRAGAVLADRMADISCMKLPWKNDSCALLSGLVQPRSGSGHVFQLAGEAGRSLSSPAYSVFRSYGITR